MFIRPVLVGLSLLGSLLLPSVASAAPYCTAIEPPHYNDGFYALWTELSGYPGQPLTCVFGDPKGTGDTLQVSERGLFFYRKATNTPTFTDGTTHVALTNRGIMWWEGPEIDPPARATYPQGYCIAHECP